MGDPERPAVNIEGLLVSAKRRHEGRFPNVSNFGWCSPGSFRRHAHPCGLLHRSGANYEAVPDRRPAPGVGVIIGGVGFGVRTEAESRMRTECRETTGTGGDTTIIQE